MSQNTIWSKLDQQTKDYLNSLVGKTIRINKIHSDDNDPELQDFLKSCEGATGVVEEIDPAYFNYDCLEHVAAFGTWGDFCFFPLEDDFEIIEK